MYKNKRQKSNPTHLSSNWYLCPLFYLRDSCFVPKRWRMGALSCNSYHLVMVKHSLHFYPYSPFQTLSRSTKMDQWENSSYSYLVKSAPDVFTQCLFPWFREILIPRSFQNRSCRETTNSFGIKFLPLGAVSYHFCLECPSCSIFLTFLTLHQSHLVFFTYFFFYNNHPPTSNFLSVVSFFF